MKKTASGLALKARHDPRVAALAALELIIAGQDSQAALEGMLASPELMPTDKGLCTELVYGSLRHWLRLESFLRRFVRKPEGLPQEMRLALQMAAYESAHLRSPDYAVANWAAGHARNRFGAGLGKVANGVLRSFQRSLQTDKDYFKLEAYIADAGGNAEQGRANFYSVPLWLLRLWDSSYGPEQTETLLAASLNAAPVGLRVNPHKADWKNLRHNLLQEAGSLPIGDCCVALGEASRLNPRPWHKEGRLSRQSAAACEALYALEPQTWPEGIWDACAGRGGKSLALIEMGVKVGLVSDPSQSRLKGLPEDFARLGLNQELMPQTLAGTVQELAGSGPNALEAGRLFNTILLDAPCSGLGTLSRRPEIRLRRQPEDLQKLAAAQTEILEAALTRLAPQGKIIYLTCTLNPAENEGQVQAFIDRHAGLRPELHLEKSFRTPADSPLGEFFYGAVIGS